MTAQTTILDFLSQPTIAVVGVSRTGRKFSNLAFRLLREKGYRVFPVNPHADSIRGERCYHSLDEIPERVDAALVIVPPYHAEQVARQAHEVGIRRLWFQQGSTSEKAAQFCEQHGISAVHGECILMFAEPVQSYHRLHRWVWKLFGKLPPAGKDVSERSLRTV